MHIAELAAGPHWGYGIRNLMTVLGTALGVCIAVWILARWRRHLAPQAEALGTVSEQWLAEHRLDRTDSQR
jgi:hypothetical protein